MLYENRTIIIPNSFKRIIYKCGQMYQNRINLWLKKIIFFDKPMLSGY